MNLKEPSFLDKSQILRDEKSLKHYGQDWTGFFTPDPALVVFPKTTDEVKKLVDWARENKTPLIPSGGRTGLSGGASALKKEVIVSFEKMKSLLEFNEFDGTLTVEAGMVTKEVQNLAEEKGFFMPISFAAEGSSQIGGNAATNAGGIHVIHYGHFRRWILGLKVVTGRGDILHLGRGLVKNAAGYSLMNLFIGSEGTLGFITEVTLALTKKPKNLHVFLLALSDLKNLMKVYSHFKKEASIHAFEMFTEKALSYVASHGGPQSPLSKKSPYYVLIETPSQERALSVFENLMNQGLIEDAVMSQSSSQAQEIWALRENISESIASFKPYKNDISVRTSKISEFLSQMDPLLKAQYPKYEVIWFGHIGDGNLHINIIKDDKTTMSDFLKDCRQVNQLLFAKIKEMGGSISAEHGVGLLKKDDLHFSRSTEEINYMKQIKKTFDPDGIINPGKIFDSF